MAWLRRGEPWHQGRIPGESLEHDHNAPGAIHMSDSSRVQANLLAPGRAPGQRITGSGARGAVGKDNGRADKLSINTIDLAS